MNTYYRNAAAKFQY